MTGPNLHLNNTLGPFFIGTLFSLILYGCTCAQALFYFWRYRADKLATKVLVTVICLLDTAENAVNVQFLWFYFVQNHANIPGALYLVSTFSVFQVTASITAFLVQCFFINNIWRLSIERWYQIPVTMIALALSMTSFISGMIMVHEVSSIKFIFDLGTKIKVAALVDLPCALATDVFIAISLCVILYNNRTGFKRTETMLSRLIIYFANRGVAVLVAQLLILITYTRALVEENFIVLIFYSSTTTLYVNTFLAVLNSRHHVKATASAFSGIECSIEIPMEDLRTSGPSSPPLSGLSAPNLTNSCASLKFARGGVEDSSTDRGIEAVLRQEPHGTSSSKDEA